MSNSPSTLGIIAGGGQFPNLVAKEAHRAGMRVVACGFHGSTLPEFAGECDAFSLFYLGQFNKIIDWLHKNGVKNLCIAGSINKPKALDIRPDLRAAKLIFSLRSKGDDALLRTIVNELEREGFQVISAASLLPSLCAPAGQLTRTPVSEEVWADIRYGWPIARQMGRFDIGQCLVVRQGMVMAVECLEGTDATLKRGAELGGKGCVAIKMVKPGQEERVDLPSIGLTTIQNLIQGNYAALALQGGKTLFFDREESIKLADAHKLAIIALEENFGEQ